MFSVEESTSKEMSADGESISKEMGAVGESVSKEMSAVEESEESSVEDKKSDKHNEGKRTVFQKFSPY